MGRTQPLKKIDRPYPPPPFPQRLKKQREESQFKQFLNQIAKLEINIPLMEALKCMPPYTKFMKDILSNKRDLSGQEIIAVTKSCSLLLKRQMPPKLRDPGAFKLPCVIGNTSVGKALCDLGASINLMPLSVFEKLGISDDHIKDTRMTLQLAD